MLNKKEENTSKQVDEEISLVLTQVTALSQVPRVIRRNYL
jgi:hypothetical protein